MVSTPRPERVKHFVIARGLPGAGKSTAIARLHPGAIVCSADHFFVGEDQVYRWDLERVSLAHQEAFEKASQACLAGEPLIVMDNTHVQRWEFEGVAALALQHGYTVSYLNVFDGGLSDKELALRNAHGVSEEVIAEMRTKWED